MQQQSARSRLIFVLIDGLRDDVAKSRLGFVEGLVDEGIAWRSQVQSVLPSLSRPCYASIFTGMTPMKHGITTNDNTQRLTHDNVFDLVAESGGTSAVAGYHWMSELFSRGPFDYLRDREQENNASGITYGRFYFEDAYPDSHVFVDAEKLRQSFDPDLLVIHPMGCDDAGHKNGASSKEYAAGAAKIDYLLSRFLPMWLMLGYQIVITADHGMDDFGVHGGTYDEVTKTPLYFVSQRDGMTLPGTIQQTEIAAWLCRLLGIKPVDSMTFSQNLQ
nr:alkaline phosphatase family protein [Bacilli bacterium]